jgi:hypothetical protein
MSPSVRDFILSVHPDSPEWIILMGEMLHEGGAETSASMAASRAMDFARIPEVGQGLQKIVEGLSDLRKVTDLRLTPMQLETLQSIYAEMMTDFGSTIDKASKTK